MTEHFIGLLEWFHKKKAYNLAYDYKQDPVFHNKNQFSSEISNLYSDVLSKIGEYIRGQDSSTFRAINKLDTVFCCYEFKNYDITNHIIAICHLRSGHNIITSNFKDVNLIDKFEPNNKLIITEMYDIFVLKKKPIGESRWRFLYLRKLLLPIYRIWCSNTKIYLSDMEEFKNILGIEPNLITDTDYLTFVKEIEKYIHWNDDDADLAIEYLEKLKQKYSTVKCRNISLLKNIINKTNDITYLKSVSYGSLCKEYGLSSYLSKKSSLAQVLSHCL